MYRAYKGSKCHFSQTPVLIYTSVLVYFHCQLREIHAFSSCCCSSILLFTLEACYGWGIFIANASPSSHFAKHTYTKTPAGLLDHDRSTARRGSFMWLHISVWLLMCEHRPRKRADYKSADSPHFLPSDLLEGLFWVDCWTAEGGWLSSETLNRANLSSFTMLDYFRQPFSASLNNKRIDPFCSLYVVLTDLSFHQHFFCHGHNSSAV